MFNMELRVTDRFDVVPGATYDIVRCQHCSLLYLNPRPSEHDLGAFYEVTGYDPFVSDVDKPTLTQRAYRAVRKFTVAGKARRISRGLPTGARILDVGCATGEMIAELQVRGYQCSGVEPDDRAAAFAREKLGLTVWTGDITAVPESAGSFDLIILWHVLEHVSDLRETLRRLKSLLSEHGKLAIAVPNPESFDARVYGNRWVAWDTPRHLYHFEPARLCSILESARFRPERGGAVAFDAFYHCLLSEPRTSTGFARACWRGGISFLRGVTGNGGSSELYFACNL